MPNNYNKKKRYPLLLTISHGHIENRPDYENSRNYSHHLRNYSDDVIYADIGGQGCSIGSYMGELFIINEINHINNNFSIDEDRIYAVGHCAGNYSVFNLATEHPDLFAGIYLRRSVFDFNKAFNLTNLPIYYAYSEYNKSDELVNQKSNIQNLLSRFTFIEIKDTYGEDLDMIRTQYTRTALDMLLSNKRNPYPSRIDYCTTKNRSLCLYYVQIESIERGKEYGLLSIQMSKNNINIHTQDISGIRICVPPTIDLSNFDVFLNDSKIFCEEDSDNSISISISHPNNYVHKGHGLLDVYCSNLSIIKVDDTDSIDYIANTMSHPESNAAYRTIYVEYPKGSLELLKESKDRALVIIDNNAESNNEDLQIIRDKLKIITTEDNFIYNNKKYFGAYVIMQIINSPWDNQKSLLYINSNSPELVYKHFFLRKMILPSYSSGFHPYLNVSALIYDGKEYYAIREWNDDIERINSIQQIYF